MKRNTKITLALSVTAAMAGLFFFRSCGPQTTVTPIPQADATDTMVPPDQTTELPYIRPVSASADVPFTEYVLTAGKDTQLVFASGSRISIPACAFSQNGTVTLKYREFHSKAELVAAGIPMNAAEGRDDFLETTGMMELRAYQGGEALDLSEGCPLKIELVNTEAGANVNLYQLDESKRSWIEKAKTLPAKLYTSAKKTIVPKAKRNDAKYKDEALKAGYFLPVKPKVANPKKYSFHFKINLQQHPELNVYDGILWEYAGSGGNDDPGKNAWVQTAQWREMRLDNTAREGVYSLTLSTREKTFTTVVKPVFEKEDMEYANDVFKDRYSKYRKYMDKKNDEENAWLAKEAKRKKTEEQVDRITRSFEINQFGIWNCDRYYTLPDPMVVAVNFDLPNSSLSIDRMYVIEKNINSVIQVMAGKGPTTLKLKKEGQYELLLLDSEVKFHKISRAAFEQQLKKGLTITLPVDANGFEMTSVNDLKKWM